MTLYLSEPAITSPIGYGIVEHLNVLINAKVSPLDTTSQPYLRHNISNSSPKFLGQVSARLRDFPVELSIEHRSRNNQLLWHALAEIEPKITACIEQFGRERIAVIIGTSTTGADENISVFKAGVQGDYATEQFNQQQILFSAPSDFVAEVYGLTGLSYGISTACTSGARALISAARLLKAGLCDAVICGGVDTLSPLTISGFSSLEVLSNQQTNPFSANRNGINIGEGAAVFVMSREPLDEHRIQLLGYGSSSDAYHMSSPHPEGEGAISAFQNALHNADLDAADIGWINLHGTGTLHNDQMESLAVAKIFGNQTACTTTKPYTGHTLGAAGAVEAAILWGMLCRQHNPTGKLPAQLWDKQADENLPNIAITYEQSRWAAGRRIGASSSFAFGGNNSVLILGESDA